MKRERSDVVLAADGGFDAIAIENARKVAAAAMREVEAMVFLFKRAYMQELILTKRIYKLECHPNNPDNPGDRESHRQRAEDIIELKSRREFYGKERETNLASSPRRMELDKNARLLLEAYAKLTCAPICRQFPIWLPRELRDMVYDAIIGPFSVKVDTILIEKLNRVYEDPLWWKDYGPFSHCWSEEFVGPDMVPEFIKRWYTTTNFDFHLDLQLIRQFLDCTTPELGIKAQLLVSNVSFNFQPSFYGNPRYPSPNLLNNLLCFKDGVRFKIKILSNDQAAIGGRNVWQYSDGMIENGIEQFGYVFETLNRLRERGSRIEAVFVEGCDILPENAALSLEGWAKRVKEYKQEYIDAEESEDGEDMDEEN